MFATCALCPLISRFGQGDNAVLAQKVAKELLAAIDKGEYSLVKIDLKASKGFKLDNPEHCVKLIQMREAVVVASVSTSATPIFFPPDTP